MRCEMRKQKDSSTPLGVTSIDQNIILEKLSKLEELLKKKNDKPLNFKEACAYLGYAPSYLYKLTYQKIIPHYKPTGKIIFFSKNELDEWIFKGSDEYRVKSDESAPQKRVKVKSAMSGKSIELKEEITIAKDPNQIDLELRDDDEIVIEFPLKSRRGKRN
ncbi:MAG: helix-turn-helix domain-containing protein [Melioribacteraceae bacterium]|nr:helix-turn-helix domain-containing protein [Melioribacteraceae bacterium]